jgi:hypothetical protein
MKGEFFHFLAAEKNEKMATAVDQNDIFTIYCESGKIINNDDFLDSEIETLRIKFSESLASAQLETKIKRQELLEKLGITEAELRILLS